MNVSESTLATAIQHHQRGELQAAERIYREILVKEPLNSEAVHLLGVIAHQVGKHEVAVELLSKAVGINPNAPPYHCN